MDRFDDKLRAVAILNIGRMDLGADQQTARIGDDMAFAAPDLLGRVITTRPAALGGLDRLTVDDPGGRARLATRGLASLQQQRKNDRSNTPLSRQ